MAEGQMPNRDEERVPPVHSSGGSSPDLRCTESISDAEDIKPTQQQQFDPRQHNIDEVSQTPVKALKDLRLIEDDRVLSILLQTERCYRPLVDDYMKTVQTELTSAMRKIVTDWMLELCMEIQSQPDVFCLAVNYLDRILALATIRKSQLQLLGAVCLLISSKFKEANPLTGEQLIYYTDNSITAQELQVRIIINLLGFACVNSSTI